MTEDERRDRLQRMREALDELIANDPTAPEEAKHDIDVAVRWYVSTLGPAEAEMWHRSMEAAHAQGQEQVGTIEDDSESSGQLLRFQSRRDRDRATRDEELEALTPILAKTLADLTSDDIGLACLGRTFSALNQAQCKRIMQAMQYSSPRRVEWVTPELMEARLPTYAQEEQAKDPSATDAEIRDRVAARIRADWGRGYFRELAPDEAGPDQDS